MVKLSTLILALIFTCSLTACESNSNSPDESQKMSSEETEESSEIVSSAYAQEEETGPSIERIEPDSIFEMEDMYLYQQFDNLQFAADENAKLSIYVNAAPRSDGVFLFDDGQEWLILLETAMGDYPLFPRKYLQIGGVSCVVYNEYLDDNIRPHFLITERQTAGYRIYDCIYDEEQAAFIVEPVYEAEGINFIVDSSLAGN